MTDKQIVEALQDAVLGNEYVAECLDKYVRAYLDIGADDDVTCTEAYWDEYTRKLQYYVHTMALGLHVEMTYDELVF